MGVRARLEVGAFCVTPAPHVGETWRWVSDGDDHPSFFWDELWLLLGNDYPNSDAFLAIQLETGEISTVFPAHDPTVWEFIL